MIKAVIFDFGGVLIDNPSEGIFSYCANALGVSREALYELVKRKFEHDFQKGTLPEDEFWEKACAELGAKKPAVSSLWGDAFRHAYSPKQEMFSLIKQLKKNGYKTGILSNTELPAMGVYHEQGYDVFDVIILSCAEKTRKPERRIYEIALKRLNIKPPEAIFIDDKIENIEGARNLGIAGILFQSPKQVKKELAAYQLTK